MAVKDVNRRKSVAVAGHSRQSIVPRRKRRAHSGVAELSPLARSRLSGPFKGILKSALKGARKDSTPSSSQRSSQGSQASTSLEDPEADASNATQTMDFTQDYQAKVHDNIGRKSMGRRVSFREHAMVRLFARPDNTNSTGSPNSSPAPSSDPPPANDENAHSKAAIAGRRSSARQSFASDMDLTGVPGGPGLMDETFSDLSDDMDLDDTDLISRRRSLPTAGPHDQLSPRGPADALSDESISFSDDMSQSENDTSQQMEFTVPLAQALRPANQNATWLELQKATHAGSSTHSEDDTDSNQGTIAFDSLQGRPSLGFGDDSFSSMEDSFEASGSGDKTLNFSRLSGRISEGQESAMDESGTYGKVLPTKPLNSVVELPTFQPPSSSSSLYPTDLLQREHTSSVFQPPSRLPVPSSSSDVFPKPKGTVFSAPSSTVPTFRPPSVQDSRPVQKSPPKPPTKKFTAAFAPPVSRPSPKKISGLSVKRPFPSDENTETGRTPVKRIASASYESTQRPTPPVKDATSAASSVPRPLSPNKKAPFESVANAGATSQSTARRPSGYFARRRSLAVGLNVSPPVEETTQKIVGSPKKVASVGLGRASMGAPAVDALQRFQKDFSVTSKTQNLITTPHEENIPPSTTLSSIPSPPSASLVPLREPSPPAGVVHTEMTEEVNGEAAAAVSTETWRQNLEPEEDEVPTISIEQFFEMTGIKFMDDLQAPRRSMHTSHLRQSRNASEISFADHAVALAIDLPQLALYSRVSSDLQAWMQQSKAIFSEAEEEAAKMTPELFVEYSRADEEGQAELLHQLELIRTNTRGLAKADWYDWKLQWIEGLRGTAEQALSELETDVRTLSNLRVQADSVIPVLQAEYDALVKELEEEQAEVADIEKCDQEYLNELKASITEQNIVVESLEAEVKEEQDQVEWLKERLTEIELDKSHTSSAIADAGKILHMQSNSTEAEVFKLRDELQTLETVHMFHATRIRPQEFEYEYASQYRVHIPCANFMPIHSKIQITGLESARRTFKDEFPVLTRQFTSYANELLRQDESLDVRGIVQTLRNYWAACSQLRLQFVHVLINFPVEIIPSTTTPSAFAVKMTILYPQRKAKAFVTCFFDPKIFAHWPASIASLQFDVEVAYGEIDRTMILKTMNRVLGCKSPSENYACIADACLEASKVF